MKHFELVKEYAYPSGSVYVLYNREKNFYIETTSMQDVNTKGKSQEIIMTDNADLIKENLVPYEEKWLTAISTQYGCPQHCQFRLVPELGFHGNLSAEEIITGKITTEIIGNKWDNPEILDKYKSKNVSQEFYF